MKINSIIYASMHLAFLCAIFPPSTQDEREQNTPIREYYNAILAAKHLVPDSRGEDNPRFSDRLLHTSLVRLLTEPETFHGKSIRIEGFLRVGFEDTAIYLSRDDASYLIAKNGFWVTIDHKEWERLGVNPDNFKDSFVSIEGLFDKDERGHVGLFSGGFKEVWRVQELKRR